MLRITLTEIQVLAALRDLEDVDVPRRTLGWWADQGIAEPSIWPRVKGPAGKKHYSLADLRRLRLIVRLRDRHGVSLPRIRPVLAFLDGRYPGVWRLRAEPTVLVDERGRVSVQEPGRAAVDVPSGQTVLDLVEDVGDVTDAALNARRKRKRKSA